ncbi:MAG: hypothetical protein KME25_30965 [Symplocastrum torsivum CPER-KK1]|jgi:hypothetical protein|uniref:Uncharacterized protein n=1 Tax=Symplocastrum torsivum CPER-KK1 TaxID=450513 RepID=A0A951PS89_9CYAN|nr:hypothetical protein [Symplocastrum torsivum CPER-KK1]
MESIAFAILLFVTYFCAACCFFYSPKNSNLTTETVLEWEPEELNSLVQAIRAEFDPQPVVEEPVEEAN